MSDHHHIRVNGTPGCLCGPILDRLAITCGHRTQASAERAARALRDQGYRAVVTKGACPEGPK